MLADADLDRAAGGIAWGGLFNAGQACLSVERVYVEDAVHDEFVERLVTIVNGLRGSRRRLRPGHGARQRGRSRSSNGTSRTPLAGPGLLPAVVDGTGDFFEPTVLVDVDHSMLCMTEETFGPTIPVMRVADTDEAVRLANDSPYGLSASVWTADRKRGERSPDASRPAPSTSTTSWRTCSPPRPALGLEGAASGPGWAVRLGSASTAGRRPSPLRAARP